MGDISAYTIETKNYIVEIKDNTYIENNLHCDEYEIGHICIGDYEELIKIVYLKDCYKITGQHCSLCEWDEDGCNAVIFISDFFYNNYLKNVSPKIPTAMFMHEMGHYVKKHYKNITNDEEYRAYQKKRYEYIMQNKILKEELEADRFAVNEVGKSIMINAIDKMISVRCKRNDAAMNIAIKEFELRKKAISKIK